MRNQCLVDLGMVKRQDCLLCCKYQLISDLSLIFLYFNKFLGESKGQAF